MSGIAIERHRLQTADGESIWYETAGDGPDLVFSHGLGGSGISWFQQVPVFARSFRCITWDQRGFGRSSNHGFIASPRQAAADLLAILDELGSTSAVLIGQSMGGWVSAGAAIAAPERVSALVLTSTSFGAPVGRTERSAPAGPMLLGRHPAVGERLPTVDLPLAYLYQELSSVGNRPGDADFFDALGATVYEHEEFARLDMPTLVAPGQFDELIPPALARAAAAHLPDAEVVVFEGCGHSAYWEAAHTWNSTVLAFLANAGLVVGEGAA